VKRTLLCIGLVLIVGALAGSTAGCGSSLPDDAVAKVGEAYITVDKFNKAVTWEANQYGITEETQPDVYKEMRSWVLDNLVANQLALLEAEKLGLTVSDEEVQTEIANYVSSYNNGDQAAFEQTLADGGYTLDEFKGTVREGLLRNKVRVELIKNVTTVPEEQIAAYYEANKADYYVEPSRKMRHILITPVASVVASTVATTPATATSTSGTATTTVVPGAVTEADWAKALATAQEVRRRLVAGGDWNSLASRYSGDFMTKDSGGDLGTVYLGESIKEFEDAAFSLGLDEISQPIRTVYGYEIIQVTSITAGGQQTLDEVRVQIESQLVSEAQDAAVAKWTEERKTEVGVIYRKDLRPATATTESPTTTVPAEATTSTAPAGATTTVQP
jgi:foldase protein PrsA